MDIGTTLLLLKKILNNLTDEQIKEIEFKIYNEDCKDWLAINLNSLNDTYLR